MSILISSTIILIKTYQLDYPYIEEYKSAISVIYENNLKDCVMYSGRWIFYNYIDDAIVMLPIEIYPRDIPNYVDKVLFLHISKQPRELFIELEQKLPTTTRTDDFIILGDLKNCKEKKDYTKLFYIYNSLYTDPCNILFSKIRPVEGFCNFINYGKFSTFYQ